MYGAYYPHQYEAEHWETARRARQESEKRIESKELSAIDAYNKAIAQGNFSGSQQHQPVHLPQEFSYQELPQQQQQWNDLSGYPYNAQQQTSNISHQTDITSPAQEAQQQYQYNNQYNNAAPMSVSPMPAQQFSSVYQPSASPQSYQPNHVFANSAYDNMNASPVGHMTVGELHVTNYAGASADSVHATAALVPTFSSLVKESEAGVRFTWSSYPQSYTVTKTTKITDSVNQLITGGAIATTSLFSNITSRLNTVNKSGSPNPLAGSGTNTTAKNLANKTTSGNPEENNVIDESIDSQYHLQLPKDMIVPLACMYTPLENRPLSKASIYNEQGEQVDTDTGKSVLYTSRFKPIICRNCGTFLTYVNSIITISGANPANSYWGCPSCLCRNPLPVDVAIPLIQNHFKSLSEQNGNSQQLNSAQNVIINNTSLDVGAAASHPALIASTVEYGCMDHNDANDGVIITSKLVNRNPSDTVPPESAILYATLANRGVLVRRVFIFLLDIAIEESELMALKRQLLAAINQLPPETLVGLITYGQDVTVWDLGRGFTTEAEVVVPAVKRNKMYYNKSMIGNESTDGLNENDNLDINEIDEGDVMSRCYILRGNRTFPLGSHGDHIFFNYSKSGAVSSLVTYHTSNAANVTVMETITGAVGLTGSHSSPTGGKSSSGLSDRHDSINAGNNLQVTTSLGNQTTTVTPNIHSIINSDERFKWQQGQELLKVQESATRAAEHTPTTAATPIVPDAPSTSITNSSGVYIRTMLALGSPQHPNVLNRFLVPLVDCDFILSSIIENDVIVDSIRAPRAAAPNIRAERAMGTAAEVAVALMEALEAPDYLAMRGQSDYKRGGDTSSQYQGRIVLFAGGPATRGPGSIISTSKVEMLRSHRDFLDGTIVTNSIINLDTNYGGPDNGDGGKFNTTGTTAVCASKALYEKAVIFYRLLQKRLLLSLSGTTTFDVFVASLDQIGITEMRHLLNETNSKLVCMDNFEGEMFAKSFNSYIDQIDLKGELYKRWLAIGEGELDSKVNMTPKFYSLDSKILQTLQNAGVVGIENAIGSGDKGGGYDAERAGIEGAQLQKELLAPASAGSCVIIEIHTSKDTLVAGVVGPCMGVPLVALQNNPASEKNNDLTHSLYNSLKHPFAYAFPCSYALCRRERFERLQSSYTKVRHFTGSDNVVGQGGTERWTCNAIGSDTTFTFIFDTTTKQLSEGGSSGSNGALKTQSYEQFRTQQLQQQRGSDIMLAGGKRFIQIVVRYTTPSGEQRIRVTSLSHHISPETSEMDFRSPTSPSSTTDKDQITLTTDPSYFAKYQCFDQTAGAIVISKIAAGSLEGENCDNSIIINSGAGGNAGAFTLNDYYSHIFFSNRAIVRDQSLGRNSCRNAYISPKLWDITKKWLDRLLVKFVKRFGNFNVGDPSSLTLSPTFSLFPSFMYNLRRSEFFMIMNISPDETTYKRYYLRNETINNSILMVQPTLFSYSMQHVVMAPEENNLQAGGGSLVYVNGEEVGTPLAVPVPLDTSSITNESIFLLDTFFTVHIVRGSAIEEWRKRGWQDLPEYHYFKLLLQKPEHDVNQNILSKRFPYPRFTSSDISSGDARHLKTRLNPSHNTLQQTMGSTMGNNSNYIATEDASVAMFMQTLKQRVVASKKQK